MPGIAHLLESIRNNQKKKMWPLSSFRPQCRGDACHRPFGGRTQGSPLQFCCGNDNVGRNDDQGRKCW